MNLTEELALTKKASKKLANLATEKKRELLHSLAANLIKQKDKILAANQLDLDAMPDTDPKKDRLKLNDARIDGLADSLRQLASLPDPANVKIQERTMDNGLIQSKYMVPLGVVGVIYESRPNVTMDVAGICLHSGNACVLKGGKEAAHSNQAIVALIHETLEQHTLEKQTVLLLPTERSYTEALLKADKYVDIIIPRGSDALIQFVRQHATIPTIETGAGVCHTYVEKTADVDKAVEIVVNARCSRPSVCNSLDCLIIDQAIANAFLPKLLPKLAEYKVEIFADERAFEIIQGEGYDSIQKANDQDFGKEWLDYKLTIKTVEHMDEALEHIEANGSKHSEAILTENGDLAERFLLEVDAAAVYHNASTRFTDGEVFGLGAEIGISTQKLHARGPFAVEKLITEKWVLRGNGQTRW